MKLITKDRAMELINETIETSFCNMCYPIFFDLDTTQQLRFGGSARACFLITPGTICISIDRNHILLSPIGIDLLLIVPDNSRNDLNYNVPSNSEDKSVVPLISLEKLYYVTTNINIGSNVYTSGMVQISTIDNQGSDISSIIEQFNHKMELNNSTIRVARFDPSTDGHPYIAVRSAASRLYNLTVEGMSLFKENYIMDCDTSSMIPEVSYTYRLEGINDI